MRTNLSLVALLSVGPMACQLEATEPEQPARPADLAASIRAVQTRMHVRFAAAQRIELAIARSDLDRARGEARILADLDEPEALGTWRPYVDEVRRAARQLDLAGDLSAAAGLAANIGLTCARCHDAIAAHVAFPAEPRPTGSTRLAAQMASHQWAATQLWQGLIGPSDEHWLAGAQALTTAPIDVVAQAATRTYDVEVDDVPRLRLYARRALAAQPNEDRAALFGKLLGTCAHCHATLRDR